MGVSSEPTCPRYAEPTFAEYADMAAEDESPRRVMDGCAHKAVCLRLMGVLCFGERGYGSGWGVEHEQALDNAARWMGCRDCDEWDG